MYVENAVCLKKCLYLKVKPHEILMMLRRRKNHRKGLAKHLSFDYNIHSLFCFLFTW
jgi:hypothetical protein